MTTPEATIAHPSAARPRRWQKEPFTVVVMEHGSDWPAALEGGAAACVALKQEPHEPSICLLHRAIRRIRKMEGGGAGIERVVVCCCDDASASAVQARLVLARGLLHPLLADAEEGGFELVASNRSSGKMKQSLVALAGVLSQEVAGTRTSIGVRFDGGEAPHRAGTSGSAHRMPRRRAA